MKKRNVINIFENWLYQKNIFLKTPVLTTWVLKTYFFKDLTEYSLRNF